MTERTEPASADDVADAGSRDSARIEEAATPPAPTPLRDLMRSLVCALLVATSVASPATALVAAPFVPALVAIRLLRRIDNLRFLVSTVSASIVAAVLVAPRDEMVPVAVVAALVLSWMLALLHVIAARLDPVDPSADSRWPEPRIATGLTPTVYGWVLAVAAVVGVVALAGAAPSVTELGSDVVDEAYAPYTDGCADGGLLEDQEDLCERIDQQRVDVQQLVDDHAPELVAALGALFAFGAAATAHMVVLARGRRIGGRVRPAWKFEQLELHWSFAYVFTAGLVCWLLALDMDGDAAVAARTAALALGTVGALAIVGQGAGLVWWITERGRRSSLAQALLVLGLLVASPVVLAFLFTLGVIDLAFHPRRRALRVDATTRSD